MRDEDTMCRGIRNRTLFDEKKGQKTADMVFARFSE